ncbi:DNA-binding protein [Cereibacter sphaeroides]|nr:DNA-binding protein [Cereibacter sphaeroides]
MGYAERPVRRKAADLPELDRFRFDEMVNGDRKVWGLPAIAQVLGCGVDKARRLANDPSTGAPISKKGGQYFALRSRLLAWLVEGDQ